MRKVIPASPLSTSKISVLRVRGALTCGLKRAEAARQGSYENYSARARRSCANALWLHDSMANEGPWWAKLEGHTCSSKRHSMKLLIFAEAYARTRRRTSHEQGSLALSSWQVYMGSGPHPGLLSALHFSEN